MPALTAKNGAQRRQARGKSATRVAHPGVKRSQVPAAARTTPNTGGKANSAVRKPAGLQTAPCRYSPALGVDDYARRLVRATPLERIEIERQGVSGAFIKALAQHLGMPAIRMFAVLRVPKATAEKKAAAGAMMSGRGAQAAIGLASLLGLAQDLVADSTAPGARTFDTAKWLGQWIERSQPSLGGCRPADLLDTPTGYDVVERLLGSAASGAYQ